jgi:DNA-binding SARP family transcriptional activator
LNQRHLFVDRLQGETPVFQYHALFRTFLCQRAQHLLGSPEWTRLQRQAASLLVEAGQTENAIPLLAQAGDWAAAARLILVESAQMLARGHSQTLTNWVRALPSWYVAATPRLLYCLGMAQIASDPEAARATLERSYERFAAESNPLGQALAAAAIVQTYYLRFDHLLGLPRWVDELTRLLSGDLVFPSAETELHVRSMLQMAMTYVRPDHPELPRCAERVESLISRGLETNLTISAAALLLTYYDWFAPEKARLLLGYVTPRSNSPDVVPFNRIWWLLAAGYHHRFQGETAHMRSAFALAEKIARQSGLRSTLVLLLLVRVYECMALGDGTAGAAELAKAAEVLTPGRRQEEYVFHLFAAQIELLQRDGRHAREHAQKAHRLACEIGHRFSEMESLGILALALCESGEGEAALRAVRQAASLPGAAASDKVAFHHLLIEAYACLRLGRAADVRNLLARAYALGRSNGYLFGFVWLPSMIATLCAEALRAGIETDYVLGVIRTCGLLPPGPDVGGNWPWPVKVRVLDRVEIEVGGKAIARSRKAQKKPLELLGALVAKGPAGADRALLAQELWPDSEGDAAESALRMNLHRLRKLLRHDESIAMQEGKIRLNDRVVWVDGWAFETACAELEGAGEKAANAEGIGRQALELYRGPAFGREAPMPWMLPARERWRGKFVTAVAVIGALEERREDWAGAAAVYQRALNADPLSEEMYRRLMECFLRQKKHAEAYAVYRRCRDMLSITLGVRPSAETEALRKTIASQDVQGETAG